MLSSFVSSIKTLLFGSPTNTNTVSRKRTREENVEVDGEHAGDVPYSNSSKKLKTNDRNNWHIHGMPSAMKKQMAHLIQSQKQRTKPTPLSETAYVSEARDKSGDMEDLIRPPIHHLEDITCKSINGTTDLDHEIEGQITERILKTNLANGHERSQAHTGNSNKPAMKSRWQAPAFQRAVLKQFPVKPNISHNDQYKPLYDKTFNSSRNSGIPYTGQRAYSFHHKKQLEERERYKQLLQQFSMCPQRPSSVAQSGITQDLSRRTSHVSWKRDIPVITLDSSISDKTALNKSAMRQNVRVISPGSSVDEKPMPNMPTVQQNERVIASGSSVDEKSMLSNSTINQSKMFTPPKHLPEKAQQFKNSPYILPKWAKQFKEKFSEPARIRAEKIAQELQRLGNLEEQRLVTERDRQKKIEQRLLEARKEKPSIEDVVFDDEEEDEEEHFPELTSKMLEEIDLALVPSPPNEILTECFKIQIKRRDMITLDGLNWLNDEVINFYMNLLVDRGGKNDYGKVHAFNTFFYPKLLSSGYTSIRRWTRKTDIFENDYLLIPVHLGMHWCLAVVDFRKKVVQYFDSMGGKNPQCLDTIRQYLCDESLDKRKTEFDLTGWTFQEMKGIPEQLNGSDCGMFACKYAEYITRGVPITFTQEHMPYFRKRMVYEILKNKLL